MGAKSTFNWADVIDPGGFYHEDDKEEIKQEEMMPSWQLETGKSLADFVKKYIGNFEPGAAYSGMSTLTSPTSQESKGLNILDEYLNLPTNENLSSASNIIKKTLAGDYDPYSSNYYKQMRQGLEKEKAQSISEAKRTAAKYGYRTSSGENNRLSQVSENNYTKVADLLASVQENERAKQLAIIPYATQVSDAQNLEMLNKVGASQQYGSLARMLEGINYQDFLRQQNEKSGVIQTAGGLYGTSVPYGMKSIEYSEPTMLAKMLSAAGGVANIIGSIKGGGGGGGSTYSQPTATQTYAGAGGSTPNYGLSSNPNYGFNYKYSY